MWTTLKITATSGQTRAYRSRKMRLPQCMQTEPNSQRGVHVIIFEQAKSLMREAELIVSADPNVPTGRLRELMHWVAGTPWFLIRGFQAILLQVGLTIGLTLILQAFLSFTSGKPYFSGDSTSWLFALVVALSLVTFSLPSRAVLNGVRPGNLLKIAILIETLVIGTKQISSLQAGIGSIEKQCLERNRRMTWALGAGWAALVWILSHGVMAPALSAPERARNIEYAAFLSIFLGLAAIAMSSYLTACRILFLTLEFAFIEAGARMDTDHR